MSFSPGAARLRIRMNLASEIEMKEHLKVKLLSLGAEARIIRKQEIKVRNRMRKMRENEKPIPLTMEETRTSLYFHRIGIVHEEARWTQLAYCFLKKTPYLAAEHKLKPDTPKPNLDRIARLVFKFQAKGQDFTSKDVQAWLESGLTERIAKAA